MRRNWLEWVVLLTSAGVLVALVGFLLVEGISDDGRPPMPVVTLDRSAAYEGADGWYVPAVVRNEGDQAAEAVVVRAEGTVEGSVEEAEVEIDYLPAGSEVEITFGFSAEPEGEVRTRAIGFRLP